MRPLCVDVCKHPGELAVEAPSVSQTLMASLEHLAPYDSRVRVNRLDHLVLTIADIGKTPDFYTGVLGMRADLRLRTQRLESGTNKMNLHLTGHELEPKSVRPTPGSADLCLIVEDSPEEILAQLRADGVAVEERPVGRAGASGPIRSLYHRDLDANLISEQLPASAEGGLDRHAGTNGPLCAGLDSALVPD